MSKFLYPRSGIIVNQSKTLTMLLAFSSLPWQVGNKKGKQSIAQSILFAGAGSHRSFRYLVDSILDRFRRSSGQRSRGAKRQQHQDIYRHDWFLSPAAAYENPASFHRY